MSEVKIRAEEEHQCVEVSVGVVTEVEKKEEVVCGLKDNVP